ncbi:MAG: hypothetical protein SNJ79_00765 [Sphingomonadaceae bacterium]
MRLAFLLALALAVSACGEREKTLVKTEEGEVRTTGDGRYTIEGADGARADMRVGDAAASDPAGIAARLPAFAPPYPGAAIVSTLDVQGTDASGSGTVISFETKDPFDKVVAFYDQRIASAGMKTAFSANQPGSAMRGVGGDTGPQTMVTITDGGDLRTVSIMTATGQ